MRAQAGPEGRPVQASSATLQDVELQAQLASLRRAEAENRALRAELEELELVLGESIDLSPYLGAAAGAEAPDVPVAPEEPAAPPAEAAAAAETAGSVGAADLAKLTVKELKALLKEKGLPVSGKKAELVARLRGT